MSVWIEIPVRQIGPHRVRISFHAAQRLVDMAVDASAVRRALLEPERTYKSPSYPRSLVYKAGDLSLATVTDEDGVLNVTTALWATEAAWHEDYKYPAPEGRAPRKHMFKKEPA